MFSQFIEIFGTSEQILCAKALTLQKIKNGCKLARNCKHILCFVNPVQNIFSIKLTLFAVVTGIENLPLLSSKVKIRCEYL